MNGISSCLTDKQQLSLFGKWCFRRFCLYGCCCIGFWYLNSPTSTTGEKNIGNFVSFCED
jgi:hypothetical protein